jgi:osmotically-inducible protein OsmY
MSKLFSFLIGAGFGAAIVYFLDGSSGSGRRAVARDKAAKYARESGGTVQSAAQAAASQAQGAVARAQHAATGGDSAPADDITLARKVETEIFRDADAPKGSVNVSAANGIVELRGQLDDRAQIDALADRARRVTGVRGVRNLLHLPGETPANLAGSSGS